MQNQTDRSCSSLQQTKADFQAEGEVDRTNGSRQTDMALYSRYWDQEVGHLSSAKI